MFKQVVHKFRGLNRVPNYKNNNILCKSRCNNVFNTTFRGLYVTSHLKAKLFVETENLYAYGLLNSKLYDNTEIKVEKNVKTFEEFNESLSKPYRTSSANIIVNTFKNVKDFCVKNNITLSDNRFDNLVDGLMDQCENLSTSELYDLLMTISEMPQCESYSNHNYHDVWSCLDDVCIWKMKDWDVPTMFKFGDIWFKMNLGKLCEYIFEVLDYLPKRADKLTKDELVHTFFLLNICRRKKVSFEFEYALENLINDMTIEDMAVVSLGYFKSQSTIKLFSIIDAMLIKLIEEHKTIHEISLTAILKAIRLTRPGKVASNIFKALDVLSDETDRLSNLAVLHIALTGTSIMSFHKKSLQKAAERILKDINDPNKVRLKDIERILNGLAMFDFEPKTDRDIFTAALEELESPQRENEIMKYPRCLICALNFLGLRNIYSYKLMDKFLDLEVMETCFGKGARNVPRELFVLDRSIDIECPDYIGNRLAPKLLYKAAKWNTDFVPTSDQFKKINSAEKLVLDTIDTVETIIGNKALILVDHVLPQYAKADIIICKDKKSKKFTKPIGFENYTLGDIMKPQKNENLTHYAVVIVGWNQTIRETSFLLGQMLMKKRQLEKTGYVPVFVIWNEFINLTPKQKQMYLECKLI
ncbi:unnamed protein product [Brassicogethes aeneus]|uniref:RAP domain-containing protein n=1 Tax=Brassicogethes aeneus TaxID=1431903 RepID=A0A9P0AVL3_BRAAE|nr:unnamed protein product [Brassicogethes aeneus]